MAYHQQHQLVSEKPDYSTSDGIDNKALQFENTSEHKKHDNPAENDFGHLNVTSFDIKEVKVEQILQQDSKENAITAVKIKQKEEVKNKEESKKRENKKEQDDHKESIINPIDLRKPKAQSLISSNLNSSASQSSIIVNF